MSDLERTKTGESDLEQTVQQNKQLFQRRLRLKLTQQQQRKNIDGKKLDQLMKGDSFHGADDRNNNDGNANMQMIEVNVASKVRIVNSKSAETDNTTNNFNTLPTVTKRKNVCKNCTANDDNDTLKIDANNYNVVSVNSINNNINNINSTNSTANNINKINSSNNTTNNINNVNSSNNVNRSSSRNLHRKQCCKMFMMSRSVSPDVFNQTSFVSPDNKCTTNNNNNPNNNILLNYNINDKDKILHVSCKNFGHTDMRYKNSNHAARSSSSVIDKNKTEHVRRLIRKISDPTSWKKKDCHNNQNHCTEDDDNNANKRSNYEYLQPSFNNKPKNDIKCLDSAHCLEDDLNSKTAAINKKPPGQKHSSLKQRNKPLTTDPLFKLQTTLLRLHNKLNDEKNHNKYISQQLFSQEKSFQTLLSKLNSQHEKRFLIFKEKVAWLMEKCEDLTRENKMLRDLLNEQEEKNKVEMEKLENEIEQLKSSKEVCTSNNGSFLKSETKSETNSNCQKKTVKPEKKFQMFPDEDDIKWNNLYKILFEISYQKLTELENWQIENRIKSTNRWKLLRNMDNSDDRKKLETVENEYETTNAIILNQERACSDCETTPDPPVSSERRTSSCPDLQQLRNSVESGCSSKEKRHAVAMNRNECESNNDTRGEPASILCIKKMVNLRKIINSHGDRVNSYSAASHQNEIFHPPPTNSSLPEQNTKLTVPIFDVFSRQKLQYKHVKPRFPRRNQSDLNNRNSPTISVKSWLENDVSSSNLSPPSSTGETADVERGSHSSTSSPDNPNCHHPFIKFNKKAVVSNFGRLCQRRNGLTGLQITSKVKAISKIDKSNFNLLLNKK
ncbi:hypothetical protein HELRODRAFT_161604 [Helobdella robusta]|uniref:Uncharacterized protein n=1 Tax=Helobdella robusta TaxID=6412 RepID=T1ERP4_HELRO|nr:hypothetical protein HELRODRAFT_161604 [Helobdella robusta]ESO02347.1 hypothetical protein HELRODRAFT_161604 [Helobdella robusta]